VTTSADRVSPARNLLLRVVSAAALAPMAVAAAYAGGWIFVAFWGVAAVAVWWEWVNLIQVADYRGPFITGACALVLAAILLALEHLQVALFIVALGAIGVVVLSSRHLAWAAGGVVYAGTLLLASASLRLQNEKGFLAILFLFATVWAADIAGYCAGKAIGGPKLAPSISPNKTWSGSIGALGASVAAAVCVAYAIGSADHVRAAVLGAAASVAAQAGDLFESRLKRRFSAKDSSGLIPGHGGVMDRVDGYIAAALVLALLDWVRDLVSDAPARFIVW
jgi:phosphatidate cytidylyltransferase